MVLPFRGRADNSRPVNNTKSATKTLRRPRPFATFNDCVFMDDIPYQEKHLQFF